MLSEKLQLLSDKINHSVFDKNGRSEASNDGTNFSNAENEDGAVDHDVPGNLEGYGGDTAGASDNKEQARRVEALIYKIANWRRPIPKMH